MKKFSRFYVWAMDAKLTMGIYFTAFVMIYLLLGLFAGVHALANLVALEMLGCAMVIGFGQAILVPKDRISAVRCLIWTLGSAALTTVCAMGFGWFKGFPAWCAVVFCTFLLFGYAAMWLGLYWKAQKETKALNDGLKQYTKA